MVSSPPTPVNPAPAGELSPEDPAAGAREQFDVIALRQWGDTGDSVDPSYATDSVQDVPGSGPELFAFVDMQLERVAAWKREIADNVKIADLRKAKHDEWLAEVNAGPERQIARTEAMLLGIAGRITFAGHAKSKRLAHGTIGRHKAKDAVEVTDAALAVEFARLYSLPYAAAVVTQDVGEIEKLRAAAEEIGLRMNEVPLKAPLLDFVKAKDFKVDEAEHGFKVVRGGDEPFVKVAEVER